MLEKDFTLYEQALALKKLGFDEECFAMFMKDSFKSRCWCKNSEFEDKVLFTSAPTFSQAFRWFRNKYGLDGVSFYNYTGYMWNIIDVKNSNATKNVTIQEDDMQQYSSKEEAEQSCLIKLIEIVKENGFNKNIY